MSKPIDVTVSESVGKALPNEFAKWSSFTRYIPYIGQVLQILGAADTGTTAYSDIYNTGVEKGVSKNEARQKAMMPALQGAVSNYMGGGTDPGQYGSGGAKLDPSWQNYVMGAGNIFGGWKSGSPTKSLGGGMSIYNDISGKGNYGKDVWATQPQQSSSGFDMSSLANLFGNNTQNTTKTSSAQTGDNWTKAGDFFTTMSKDKMFSGETSEENKSLTKILEELKKQNKAIPIKDNGVVVGYTYEAKPTISLGSGSMVSQSANSKSTGTSGMSGMMNPMSGLGGLNFGM